MKSPKQKLTPGKLKRWRVSILRARGQHLGIVAASDRQSAEDKAIEAFGLGEDQRKRPLVMEGE